MIILVMVVYKLVGQHRLHKQIVTDLAESPYVRYRLLAELCR